jgi:hypothetical protein
MKKNKRYELQYKQLLGLVVSGTQGADKPAKPSRLPEVAPAFAVHHHRRAIILSNRPWPV